MNESLIQAWGVGLGESFQTVGSGALQFLPQIIVALVIFIAGWAVGVLIGRVALKKYYQGQVLVLIPVRFLEG